MGSSPIQIAILDMYDGAPNIGMHCIHNIINDWADKNNYQVAISVFNVRGECALPENNFDIYISSGGPGSPIDTVHEKWDQAYTQWLNEMRELHKPVFLICHSFQIACRHFELGTVSLRRSRQIGILPVHTLFEDAIFNGLQETFYALESRSYQITAPHDENLSLMNAQIMALEKMRPSIPLERAIMAIKFSETMYGVQFHPEAALKDLIEYFNQPSTKASILEEFGIEKWERIIDHLDESSPITYTYTHLIPNFLDKAIGE